MGCDIHGYLEYSGIPKKEDLDKGKKRYWRSMGDQISLNRNYYMFGTLCKGVRGDLKHTFIPKGIPEDIGYFAQFDNRLHLTDNPNEGGEEYADSKSAKRWVEQGISEYLMNRDGKPYAVTHPDWHSHSYLSTAEFKEAFEMYKKNLTNEGDDSEGWGLAATYYAVLGAMEAYETRDMEARFVFWFDN